MTTLTLPFSKFFAAELVFSKTLEDITFGLTSCLRQTGALPGKLVCDREGALHRGAGRPSDGFAAWLGAFGLGWIFLRPNDPEAKGALERVHRFVHGNFEAGRSFSSPEDLRHRLDLWLAKINRRRHRTTRQVVARHFEAERRSMRPFPKTPAATEFRKVVKVSPQPYFRFDRVDYSLDPRLLGRRVEVRAGQHTVTAIELDTGRLACRHQRVFAAGITVTDPAHQKLLLRLRQERHLGGDLTRTKVEIRPLSSYDRLIAV